MTSNPLPTPIDYTNKDYESLRTALLELAKEKLKEWTDHSPNDLGVVLVELFAHMGDLILYYQDRLANESFLETATERASVMHLLRLIGYELRPPQPASVELSLLFAQDFAGQANLPTGAEFKTVPKDRSEPVHFQYLGEPVTYDLSNAPVTTDPVTGKKFRVASRRVPVVQVDRRIGPEIVGSSDGSPAQRFALKVTPLILSTLSVSVQEGVAPVEWTRVESLFSSGPTDMHYSVAYDENNVAWLEFGDGVHGKVPRRGHNNLQADYRVGGGAKGNVGIRTLTKVVTTGIAGLSGAYNLLAASGGADAEPIEQASRRAPKIYRTMGRAVTSTDFEAHARAFGVAKARAREAGWNTIALFVAPAGGGEPSELLSRDLERYFEDKRMMTAMVQVFGPDYEEVRIQVEIEVAAQFFADEVGDRARAAVESLIAFDVVDFGSTLYLSKVYEALEALEGVRAVNVTDFSLRRGMPSIPSSGKLEFGWKQIPTLGALDVSLQGGRSRA